MHMCTPHKARGDKWQPHAEAGRAKYKMNSAEDFTARPHIQLRGCATQVTSPNFLHETVNIRWAALADRLGLARTAEPDINMWVDARHAYERQQKNGSLTLLGHSLPYNYKLDRVMLPEEACRHQGWPSSCALNCSLLAVPVPGMTNGSSKKVLTSMPPPEDHPKKKARHSQGGAGKRGPLPDPGGKLVDMAGNMMCVPDFVAVWFVGALSINCCAWEHQLPPDFVPHLSQGISPAAAHAAGWIDHTQNINQQVVDLVESGDEEEVSDNEGVVAVD